MLRDLVAHKGHANAALLETVRGNGAASADRETPGPAPPRPDCRPVLGARHPGAPVRPRRRGPSERVVRRARRSLCVHASPGSGLARGRYGGRFCPRPGERADSGRLVLGGAGPRPGLPARSRASCAMREAAPAARRRATTVRLHRVAGRARLAFSQHLRWIDPRRPSRRQPLVLRPRAPLSTPALDRSATPVSPAAALFAAARSRAAAAALETCGLLFATLGASRHPHAGGGLAGDSLRVSPLSTPALDRSATPVSPAAALFCGRALTRGRGPPLKRADCCSRRWARRGIRTRAAAGWRLAARQPSLNTCAGSISRRPSRRQPLCFAAARSRAAAGRP